jgi:hypothetical protein
MLKGFLVCITYQIFPINLLPNILSVIQIDTWFLEQTLSIK